MLISKYDAEVVWMPKGSFDENYGINLKKGWYILIAGGYRGPYITESKALCELKKYRKFNALASGSNIDFDGRSDDSQ